MTEAGGSGSASSARDFEAVAAAGSGGRADTKAGRGGSGGEDSLGTPGLQRLAAASRHRRGELDLDLDSLPHLFVSFGNAAYFPFVHNWARSVEAIGAPYFVAGAAWAEGLGRA